MGIKMARFDLEKSHENYKVTLERIDMVTNGKRIRDLHGRKKARMYIEIY